MTKETMTHDEFGNKLVMIKNSSDAGTTPADVALDELFHLSYAYMRQQRGRDTRAEKMLDLAGDYEGRRDEQ